MVKNEKHIPLLIAAACSTWVALLHIGIAVVGPKWYSYFGAPSLAEKVEHGEWLVPTVMCLVVALITAIWAIYALSAVAIIRRMPLLRTGLVTIGAIYFLRGLQVFPEFYFLIRGHLDVPRYAAFSAFSLFTGLCYLIGAKLVWRTDFRWS
jgi:hypothetical protein